MKQCEFCGAILPEMASFCGKCGQIPSQISQKATLASDLPTSLLAGVDRDDDATILTPSGKLGNLHTSTGPLHPVTLIPIPDEEGAEEEEEKRRRGALIGLGLPALGDLANQPTQAQIPGVQGTPQTAQMPDMSGTPTGQGNMPSSPGTPAMQSGTLPSQTPLQTGNPPPSPQPQPPSGKPGASQGSPTGSSPGCLTIGAIIMASLLIILLIIIGLGLTILAPQLSLSGSSSVTPGSTMTLHGSSFLPNSSVTLTLDSGTPLYVQDRHAAPAQLTQGNTQHAASVGLLLLSPLATNVIHVQGDGTFNLSFQVNPTWAPGQHTIHATESVSHRSASLTFTILQPGASVTPTPTLTNTPTLAPTATPTPKPTPTTAPPPAPTLSCVTPGTLALGPVSELSSQTASGNVTLCASGSGTLT